MNQFCGPLAQLVEQFPFKILHSTFFAYFTTNFGVLNALCCVCAKDIVCSSVCKNYTEDSCVQFCKLLCTLARTK